MELINTRLDFQIRRLGYQFQNIDLFIEAVTHSVNTNEYNCDFPEKNKNNERLCALGESVLKLVVSRYVLMATKVSSDNMTWLKSQLLDVSKQNEIGQKLFCGKASRSSGVTGFLQIVRVCSSNWINPGFRLPYHKIIKSLFGAVFVDAGGSFGIGLGKCHQLFLKLWKPYLKHNELKKIQQCFPSPKHQVNQFWLKNGINLIFIQRMEERLGVKFEKGDILCEAVIQKGFYDPIRNDPVAGKMHHPDYERLEFLGDSVLGVVITEHIFHHYPHANATDVVAKVTGLITDDYQMTIFDRLHLENFVRMKKKSKIWERGVWNKQGDIVEAVIGAIFVDGGMWKAKDFVERSWDLPRTFLNEPTLMELQQKLNYKFKNEKYLVMTLERVIPERIERYSLYAAAALNIIIADYYIRSSDIKTLRKTDQLIKSMLDSAILGGIAFYLNLRAHLIKNDDEKENIEVKKMQCKSIVLKMLGAVWLDMKTANENEIFREIQQIFYHLWNPYLKPCSVKQISDRLHKRNGTKAENINFGQLLQKNIPYKFANDELCQQLQDKDNLDVLQLIGEQVLHFIAVKAENLKSRKKESETEANVNFYTAFIDLVKERFKIASMLADCNPYVTVNYAKCSPIQKEKLETNVSLALVGATFVDDVENETSQKISIINKKCFSTIFGVQMEKLSNLFAVWNTGTNADCDSRNKHI